MIQIREKRLCTRSDSKFLTTIENLSFGLFKAVMINCSEKGSYIETNYPILLGKEIYIGIKSSPYNFFSREYECCRAKIIRKQKSLYTSHNYGYGIKYTFVHDDQNIKNQRYIAIKNQRKYLRKPYPLDILFLLNNQLIEGSIKNISTNGAFIETQKSFSGGEIVKLYKLKIKNNNSKLIGKVVWHNANGIGIQFLKSNKK